jgi:hypothetical protein
MNPIRFTRLDIATSVATSTGDRSAVLACDRVRSAWRGGRKADAADLAIVRELAALDRG